MKEVAGRVIRFMTLPCPVGFDAAGPAQKGLLSTRRYREKLCDTCWLHFRARAGDSLGQHGAKGVGTNKAVFFARFSTSAGNTTFSSMASEGSPNQVKIPEPAHGPAAWRTAGSSIVGGKKTGRGSSHIAIGAFQPGRGTFKAGRHNVRAGRPERPVPISAWAGQRRGGQGSAETRAGIARFGRHRLRAVMGRCRAGMATRPAGLRPAPC